MDTQLLATSGVHVLFLLRARAAWPVDFTQWSWKLPCGRPSAIWLSRPPPGSCWSVWTIRRIDNRSYSLVRHLPNSSPPAAPPKFWPGSLLSPQPSWWPSPSARRRRWQQRWHPWCLAPWTSAMSNGLSLSLLSAHLDHLVFPFPSTLQMPLSTVAPRRPRRERRSNRRSPAACRTP